MDNFGHAQKRFRTVSKDHSTVDKYSLQLARVKVDIAKRQKPQDAYPRLMEAKKIFAELGFKKELAFVEKMLGKY